MSGSWSGGVAMSASANTIRSEVAASIPLRTAAPLPPCGTDRSRSRGVASSGTCASGARRHERGRGIGAAVVDDQDLDPLGEAGRAGRPVPRALAAAPQVAEQLVERRADAGLLVEGRQDDGQAGGQGHRRKSTGRVAVGWSC